MLQQSTTLMVFGHIKWRDCLYALLFLYLTGIRIESRLHKQPVKSQALSWHIFSFAYTVLPQLRPCTTVHMLSQAKDKVCVSKLPLCLWLPPSFEQLSAINPFFYPGFQQLIPIFHFPLNQSSLFI